MSEDQIPGIPGKTGPFCIRYNWHAEMGLWHETDIVDPNTQGLSDHVVLISVSEIGETLSSLFLPLNGKTGCPMRTGQEVVLLAAWAQILLERLDLPSELAPVLLSLVDAVHGEDDEPETP